MAAGFAVGLELLITEGGKGGGDQLKGVYPHPLSP